MKLPLSPEWTAGIVRLKYKQGVQQSGISTVKKYNLKQQHPRLDSQKGGLSPGSASVLHHGLLLGMPLAQSIAETGMPSYRHGTWPTIHSGILPGQCLGVAGDGGECGLSRTS